MFGLGLVFRLFRVELPSGAKKAPAVELWGLLYHRWHRANASLKPSQILHRFQAGVRSKLLEP